MLQKRDCFTNIGKLILWKDLSTSFDETCEVKKATNFEKLHEMKKEKKKEHLRQAIASHFRSEDISCVEKHYLPQNTKHLKGKKRQKGNI